MKLSEDELKRLLKLREAVAGKEEDEDLEIEDGEPFPDIPDIAEQPAKEKEKTAQKEVSSPIKKGPDAPALGIGEILRKKMGIQEEVQVKERPKVGRLNPEAIKALASAKEKDAQRAAERVGVTGEPRVSVTSAELQPHSDIPIPPPPPLPAELETHSGIPIPPPMMESPPAPPLETRTTVAMEESSIPSAEKRRTTVIEEPSIPSVEKRKTTVIEEPSLSSSERRATVAMDESSIPLVEKRKTTVSEIPAAKDNKDLDIVIKDLEHLQQEVSGKIGPKNAKELAGHINKIKEDYNSKSGEEQAQTIQKNLQSLEKWSSEKEKETASKSTWKKIGTVISSCISLVGAKIAGKETENIKNNLAQAMKELKTGGKKEVGEWVSKIKQEASKNQERSR